MPTTSGTPLMHATSSSVRWRKRSPLNSLPKNGDGAAHWRLGVAGAGERRHRVSLPPRYTPERIRHMPFCRLEFDTPDKCNSVTGRPPGLVIGDSHWRPKCSLPKATWRSPYERLKSEWLSPVREGKIRPDFCG